MNQSYIILGKKNGGRTMDKRTRIQMIIEMLQNASEKQVERLYYFIKAFLSQD